jgi:type III pantothenate kinase
LDTKQAPILAIDAGNTNTAVGLFRNNRLVGCTEFPTTGIKTLEKTIRRLMKSAGIEPRSADAAVSSVVPGINAEVSRQCGKLTGRPPVFLNHKNSGVRILYKKPGEVGADRLANAIAGYKLSGGPLLVIDFGTAITFDCVGGKGEYLGGIIMPGPEISAKALRIYTAKLPLVKFTTPKHLIGQSTEECIKSGLYNGYVGAINHITLSFVRKLGKQAKVISTGGYAGVFKGALAIPCRVVPDLTLRGLVYFIKNEIRRLGD